MAGCGVGWQGVAGIATKAAAHVRCCISLAAQLLTGNQTIIPCFACRARGNGLAVADSTAIAQALHGESKLIAGHTHPYAIWRHSKGTAMRSHAVCLSRPFFPKPHRSPQPHLALAGGTAVAASTAQAFADGGVAIAQAAATAFAAGDNTAAIALAQVCARNG